MLNFLPRDEKYFDRFNEMAVRIREAARILERYFQGESPVATVADQIKRLEHECDEISHEVLRGIDRTFITPIDREDIHRLASGLDDVLDLTEAVSDLMVLHRIEQPLDEMRQQADVLFRATQQVENAMGRLKGFGGLEPYWVEINRLENEGDRVYRKTVARLFSGEYKAMDVLKWKDLVDQLEAAIDKCEDVANTMESIVLKHA